MSFGIWFCFGFPTGDGTQGLSMLGKHSAPESDSSPTATSVGSVLRSSSQVCARRSFLLRMGVEGRGRLRSEAFSSEVDIRVLSVAGSSR